jgi:hypothetical protein
MSEDTAAHPALSDAKLFCDIIGDAAACKLRGHWHGSVHGSHPRGIIRSGLRFRNDWHVGHYCCIAAAPDPNDEWTEPDNNSRAHGGDPLPHPKNGEEITVWSRGEWKRTGPWCSLASDILYDLASEIAESEASKAAAKIAAAEARENAETKKWANLEAAYGKGA